MKKLSVLLCLLCCTVDINANNYLLVSPDGLLSVTVSDDMNLNYKINYKGQIALEPSPLGIYRDDCTYNNKETISKVSDIEHGVTEYDNARGKCSHVCKDYVQQEFKVDQKKYAVVFRVYNNGVAYAYRLLGNGEQIKVYGERSGFAFPQDSKCFLEQLAKAKSGWEKTNPSYEDPYHCDVSLNEQAEQRVGWTFPALIHHGNLWTLVSETGVTGDYLACHLSEADGNLFHVEFPAADHNLASDPTWASMKTPAQTPWRILVVTDILADIVETTLPQDLVEPLYTTKYSFKPGKATWSWIYYGDDMTTYNGTMKYIDLAAQLHFPYCLIDAQWDQKIGRGRIKSLVDYGKSKGVGLILWYNSNGSWNTAPQTPLNCMNTQERRQHEMQWLHDMGIVGIKVDFFGGDKQNGMKLYEDILRDANEYGIMCNFHGATLPRGWDRMYPSFMNAEAVMGQEFCRGEADKEANRPHHATTLPFIRNAVAPMDFTPVAMNNKLGPNGWESTRSTTTAFELALPIVFFEPIAHFGITPDDLQKFPKFVWNYFRTVPTVWDETKYLSGYPGKDIVLARRSGKTWYIGGLNGEFVSKALTIDLSFAKGAKKVTLITNDNDKPGQVEQHLINIKKNKNLNVILGGNDGVVLIIQ